MHVYGTLTDPLDTEHRARQHFGILALFFLHLVGVVFLLFFELDIRRFSGDAGAASSLRARLQGFFSRPLDEGSWNERSVALYQL